MNEAKKTTFLDRIRKAWRAFCGKPASSLTLGLEVKRCSECPRRDPNEVADEVFDKIIAYTHESTPWGEITHEGLKELKKRYKEGRL